MDSVDATYWCASVVESRRIACTTSNMELATFANNPTRNCRASTPSTVTQRISPTELHVEAFRHTIELVQHPEEGAEALESLLVGRIIAIAASGHRHHALVLVLGEA